MALTIAEIALAGGTLAIAAMPGRAAPYADDLADLLLWQPDLVVSLTTDAEMAATAPRLSADLAHNGIRWLHFPIRDFSIPAQSPAPLFSTVLTLLPQGGRVLFHCMGGCGRSGMIALCLMVTLGEAPEPALKRLRAARPCAVETPEQLEWASRSRPYA